MVEDERRRAVIGGTTRLEGEGELGVVVTQTVPGRTCEIPCGSAPRQVVYRSRCSAINGARVPPRHPRRTSDTGGEQCR